MAVGGFNPNCIVPVTTNITVGTIAVQIKNSSTLSVKFGLANPGSVPIYIGDSNVASSRFTVKMTAGSTVTFGPEEVVGGRQKESFDLAYFYMRATAASQTATLTIYSKGGPNNGPF